MYTPVGWQGLLLKVWCVSPDELSQNFHQDGMFMV